MKQPAKIRNLDKIDLAILDALQKNARISNVNLAKQVNLSASPCLDRVKRLETEGYIERYSAILNANLLKLGLTAYVEVTLDKSTTDVFNHFAQHIQKISQVIECDMVAGGFDYLLKIKIADMEEYRAILGDLVDIPGVAKNHTYVVIEKIKTDQGLPIL
jgi:Lrp/AsnC family transcriptional regulator, leucine-responsive regulatory protein